MRTSGMGRILSALTMLGVIVAIPSFRAFGQSGTQGKVVVTVEDVSGAVVPGAKLTLVENQTNDTFSASTNNSGDYTFVNLPVGVYTLSISRSGYATKVYSAVVVQVNEVTDLTAQLTVGSTTETVHVAGQTSPVLQTTSNEISTPIDMKQIQDLPIEGRDVSALIQVVPGFQGQGGYGTFNGLPLSDQGSNMDGMVGASERMKFGGNTEPAVEPRLEDIEQMSVQTDQLGLNSGFGQATTQLSFVTKRGSNQFHGLLYEDFQNDGLNANSWYNDAAGVRKNKLIRNDFGASVGGPILHNRLFFFGSFATLRVPGSFTTSNNVFTGAAQAGNFSYGGNTVNLLTVANNYNAAHPTATPLPTTINPEIAKEFSSINSAESSGALSGTSDPNMETLAWNNNSPDIEYYPVARLDYNLSQKARMYLTWSMTQVSTGTSLAPYFPGSAYSDEVSGQKSRNFTGSYGFDYIFSPKLINQFKAGFLYDWAGNPIGGAPLYATENPVFWDYPGGNSNMSGVDFYGPITTYYPVWDFSDSMTLQRGKHTFSYGGSWYREQDHYWNGPGGYYNYSLGLASGDPAINAFTNGTGGSLPGASQADLSRADALYAILTGRISGVSGENAYDIKSQKYSPTGTPSEYPLDEVASNWSFFGEDSWRVTPTLTLNYGLRWDVYGAEKDLTGFYHSADLADIYGPTPVGALFQPGNLGGVQNPQISKHTQPFAPWRVTPQPAFGFAWNPRADGGPLAALLGGDKTVIRGGYALRRFTESYQYYWDYATDYGQFYYQQFNLIPNNSGQTGTYAPGSLALGNAVPAPLLSPPAYADSYPESEFTFTYAGGANGVQPNLDTPTSESWNFGIQRGLGHNEALEVRYNGNHTLHQWIALDLNEINVFESGVLKDFQNAQKNLAASGGTSFAPSYGNAMPLITAAFGGPNASDFTNQQFIQELNTGQVGAFAAALSSPNGTVDYFCNLVGAGFSPCATTEGYTGAGAGYPINLLEANPYSLLTEDDTGNPNLAGELASEGYSNYNGLQVDLRQGAWHGLQFDANYTYSHTLALESPNSWTGSFNAFTLRDLRRGYGPGPFDIRHVVHANGTYDLPFGTGRPFLNNNKALNAVVGGFTVGTIVTIQTGAPVMLAGQYLTYNDYGDSGVQLNGVSRSQLQSAIGLREDTGQPYVNLINPKYLASTTGGGANPTYITPNTTPGTFGQVVYLHGPHQFFQDMELTKRFPIHEAMNFNLQGSFINVWNHPAWGSSGLGGGYAAGYPSSFDNGIQDYSFGEESGPSNAARVIEMRGNFVF